MSSVCQSKQPQIETLQNIQQIHKKFLDDLSPQSVSALETDFNSPDCGCSVDKTGQKQQITRQNNAV